MRALSYYSQLSERNAFIGWSMWLFERNPLDFSLRTSKIGCLHSAAQKSGGITVENIMK